MGVIRESIFGVDIQPIATEIARLRCFLTLIVEENVDDDLPNRGIQPLPNLDFKFVTADSLIQLPDERKTGQKSQAVFFEDTSHIDELKRIRNNYFGANPEERLSLQAEFNSLQTDMTIKNLDEYKGEASKLYNALSRWKPFSHIPVDWFDADWMFGVANFDIVIANPPYLGEKGHSELFRKIKEDGLKNYYLGKMDLFYFFFHHGLNLVKNNGIVSFISTNYYPTAAGARKLRKDFYDRCDIKELVNFNELKIFESALGQHNMISILQKGVSNNAKTLVSMCNAKGLATGALLADILDHTSDKAQYSKTTRDDLFDGKDLYIRFHDNVNGSSAISEILSKIAQEGKPLATYCNVNNGVFAGADSLNLKKRNKYQIENANEGEGIFVLKNEEVENLKLSNEELKLIKPLFKNSDIKRYFTKLDNEINLINLRYTDRPKIDDFPNIKNHLIKFKDLLSDRPRTGTLESAFNNGYWYVMSTSRKLNFDGEKIVFPQRSTLNTFGYNDTVWYAMSDVFFITSKTEFNTLNLKYVLALLNSKLYYIWLYYRGKRKGETLELTGNPVSEIPIRYISDSEQKPFIYLVDEILSLKKLNSDADIKHLESQIDQLVYRLYSLSPEEIAIIEEAAK